MRFPRTMQPTSPVALTGRYTAARQPLVLLPSVYGLRNPYGLGGSWSFSSSYAGTVGTRIVEGALRFYADYGVNNDDTLTSEFPISTARTGSAAHGFLTTVVRFKAFTQAGAGDKSQSIVTVPTAGDLNGPGHVVAVTSAGTGFQVGYNGGNGYDRSGAYIPNSPVFETWHTAVISSRPGKDPSVSVDGGPCPTLTGQEWYVGDTGGNVQVSAVVRLGHSQAYPDYYHFNGLIALAAFLPGIYIAQDEAQRLAINPWQIFEPEPRKIFLPPAVTTTTKKWRPAKVTRTTQPIGVPELDDTNPLTRGLNMLIVPWVNDGQLKLWDLVNKRWATPTENNAVHSIVRTKAGIGADNNDQNDNAGGGWITNVPANTILSALVVASHRNNGVTRGPVLCADYGNYLGFPSGTPRLMNNGTLTGSATTWPQGVVTALAARCQLTKYAVAQDGVITGTNSVSDWPALGPGTAGARICGLDVGYNYYPITCYLAVGWNRYLSDGELKEASGNPWQLFKSSTRAAFSDRLTLVPVYVGRPISDVSAGAWLPSSGGALAPMLDEEVASDTDYIYVESASTCEVALTALGDPGTSTGHRLSVRMTSPQSKSARVSIRQGANTEIAAFTQVLTNSPVTYNFDLTGPQIDSITDYTDLRLRIEGL